MAKIEVILTQDVAGQGRKGDIISVSDGYAHNFLFKNKKAVLVTPDELSKIERKQKKDEKKQSEEKDKALNLKTKLESEKIVISVKTGENGKLFGAVTNKEISAEIKNKYNLDIDRKKIECNLKNLGVHIVPVKLYTEIKADLEVEIVPK